MKSFRVLIISGHPLFADAITHLLKQRGIDEIFAVAAISDAVALLDRETPETIIVDHDDPNLNDAEIVSQLVSRDESPQIIFLTLSGNQMIVHHRERIANVTPDDLIQALQPRVE